jgi:hypothetical protein
MSHGLTSRRTITTAIERYTINIAEDIRDIKNKLEGGEELMRGLTRQLTLRLKTANEREEETRSTLREIDNKLLRERESRRGGTRKRRWSRWIAIAGQSAFQIAIQLAFTSLLARNGRV